MSGPKIVPGAGVGEGMVSDLVAIGDSVFPTLEVLSNCLWNNKERDLHLMFVQKCGSTLYLTGAGVVEAKTQSSLFPSGQENFREGCCATINAGASAMIATTVYLAVLQINSPYPSQRFPRHNECFTMFSLSYRRRVLPATWEACPCSSLSK
jgi:hypothetical protein